MTAPHLNRGALIVPGHALVGEGDPYDEAGRYVLQSGPGHALCRCGWLSEALASTRARKAAHREHKRQVAEG